MAYINMQVLKYQDFWLFLIFPVLGIRMYYNMYNVKVPKWIKGTLILYLLRDFVISQYAPYF